MIDTSDKRLDRLFAAARAAESTPSPREEGFENRLMLRLRERREPEAPWYAWAWRCSPVLAGVVMVLMVGTGITGQDSDGEVSLALTDDVENGHLISYLTGE